jgi:hypothetical protein
MFCNECGNEVSGAFCNECGSPVADPQPIQAATAPAAMVPVKKSIFSGSNLATAAACALTVIAGLWFYCTPYITLWQFNRAMKEKNAEKAAKHVDFPVLKENLKVSLKKQIEKELETERNSRKVLALRLTLSFLGQFIDEKVNIAGIEAMLNGQKPGEKVESVDKEFDIDHFYENYDTFAVSVKKKGTRDVPARFIFSRNGLATWKLSNVVFPN